MKRLLSVLLLFSICLLAGCKSASDAEFNKDNVETIVPSKATEEIVSISDVLSHLEEKYGIKFQEAGNQEYKQSWDPQYIVSPVDNPDIVFGVWIYGDTIEDSFIKHSVCHQFDTAINEIYKKHGIESVSKTTIMANDLQAETNYKISLNEFLDKYKLTNGVLVYTMFKQNKGYSNEVKYEIEAKVDEIYGKNNVVNSVYIFQIPQKNWELAAERFALMDAVSSTWFDNFGGKLM